MILDDIVFALYRAVLIQGTPPVPSDVRGMAGCSLLEALLGGLPVDDVPDGAKVFRFAVLVLQAEGGRGWSALFEKDRARKVGIGRNSLVCVLPSVDSEQGSELSADSVLVLCRHASACISSDRS